MTNDITPTKPKAMKLKPKQRETISNWLDPNSPTYGNLYQSAIKAGFKRTYALNLSHLRPSWLSETLENAQLEAEHIKQGIQQLAMQAPDSRSPDDTRLKAYELLAKITGLIDSKHQTNVTLVQPILGAASTPPTPNKTVIDL